MCTLRLILFTLPPSLPYGFGHRTNVLLEIMCDIFIRDTIDSLRLWISVQTLLLGTKQHCVALPWWFSWLPYNVLARTNLQHLYSNRTFERATHYLETIYRVSKYFRAIVRHCLATLKRRVGVLTVLVSSIYVWICVNVSVYINFIPCQWTSLILKLCFYVATIKCIRDWNVATMSSHVVALLDFIIFYLAR